MEYGWIFVSTGKFDHIGFVNNTKLKWISCCLSFDFANKKIRLDVNGKHLNTVENIEIEPEKGETTVFMGYRKFDNNPMIGKMTDINVWDRLLTKQEGLQYSSCQNYIEKQGDIINKTTRYNITGSLIEQISVPVNDFLCTLDNTRITLYVHAPFLNFRDAKEACDKFYFNSIIGPFTDIKKDWIYFHLEANENAAVKKYCWNGGRHLHWMPYEDQSQNLSNFIHIITNQKLNSALVPLSPRFPSSNEFYGKCMMAYLGILNFDESWVNWKCQHSSYEWAGCVACWLPNTPNSSVVLNLRGICKRSKLDEVYQVRNAKNGLITYIGQRSTIIFYNEDKGLWMMRVVNNPNVSAVADASMSTFALGVHQWEIFGDTECNRKPSKMMLTLSTCSKDQFTCSNGLCVEIKSRCDSKNDCPDKSDEINCKRISTEVSYQKQLPPPQEQYVEVSVDLLTIQEINEIDSVFHVWFNLYLTWYDTRLRFENLNHDTKLNVLTTEDKRGIWYPYIYFENTQNKIKVLMDAKTYVYIERNGDFTSAPSTEYENKLYYQGSENNIKLFRYFNIPFKCNYNMKYYPFDVQVCQIILNMPGNIQYDTTMKAGVLNYFGKRELQQYFIKNFTMKVLKNDSETLIEIDVTLGRRLLGIFLTIFFPTLILNIISYGTNFFKTFKMDTIKVNLTTMLVLATIFRSVRKWLYIIFLFYFSSTVNIHLKK